MATENSTRQKFQIIAATIAHDNNLLNITQLCKIAGVSHSGYYNWCRTTIKNALIRDEQDKKDFELILKAFKENQKVHLSFQNIEMLTTAFLNTSVGQLYKDHSEDYIKANLSVSDLTESGKVALKRVVITAKLYYKDPEALQRSIDEITEE